MEETERDKEELYRVVTDTFVAGVFVVHGRVVQAAPILRRWTGRALDDLRESIERCGGSVTRLG
jgi:hypothetical protein